MDRGAGSGHKKRRVNRQYIDFICTIYLSTLQSPQRGMGIPGYPMSSYLLSHLYVRF